MKTRAWAATAMAMAAGGALGVVAPAAMAGPPQAAQAGKSEKPTLADIVKKLELTKVISTTDGSKPFYELYKNDENGKLLAVLPGGYEGKLTMFAGTVSGGDEEAGVMGPTVYAAWHKYDDQLALVAPNLGVRTDGDKQAKDSIERLFSGTLLATAPIIAEAPGGRPVIDLGSLGLNQASAVFRASPFGGYGPSLMGVDPRIKKLTKTKAFPENVIFEYEFPEARTGVIKRLTWSISDVEGTPGFKPRAADNRVGYFYDYHVDYAKPAFDDVAERYITRWHIEKADPKLKMSPPKEPIVWYIEHTTPIRYRRWVREGIELWNEAFEEIGIVGALEVRQQDSATGAYMDIDPEDARYNFFRWSVSSQGYAIGPSRTNPRTGEILDADVVWHQGLTRAVRNMLESLSNDIAEQAFDAETLAFFDEHPAWDPRVRLAPAARQRQMVHHKAVKLAEAAATDLTDADANPWSPGLNAAALGGCRIGNMLAMDVALFDAALAVGMISGDHESEDAGDELDGMPEAFIGPMIRYISCHEVGHCIGLQHNMAASTIRSLEEINDEDYEGATIGSVMDYVAANINPDPEGGEYGDAQGMYATPTVGPYDRWAVAFGYGPEKDVEKVLSRVSEPDLVFVSQSAMSTASDPRNMTWDMGEDNLKFARSRLEIVQDLRSKLVDEITDEGESWATVRRRYGQLLGTHIQALVVSTPWVGGSYINNDRKGDPGDRTPIEDVPAAKQREALNLIIDNAFEDEAFGLTPELVRHFGKEHFWDGQGISELMADASPTIHDTVGGVQATALSLLMNPSRLRRVYDNEFRAEDANPFTMAEMVTTITDRIWSRDRITSGSSFERNLQREHLDRLIDLALLETTSPTLRTISTLARGELERIKSGLPQAGRGADAYAAAHVADIRTRIEKAQDAAYVIRQ